MTNFHAALRTDAETTETAPYAPRAAFFGARSRFLGWHPFGAHLDVALATRLGRFHTMGEAIINGSQTVSTVVALPGTTGQPEARLIQLLCVVGPQHFVNVTRYPADDA